MAETPTFKPYRTIGEKLWIAIKFIVVTLIIGLTLWFLINLWLTGAGPTALEHGKVAAVEIGTPILKNLGLYEGIQAILDPARLVENYDFISTVEENENNPDAGVRIESFNQRGTAFEADPITLDGFIKLSPLKDMEVNVYCKLEGYPKEGVEEYYPAELSSLNAKGNTIYISKEQGMEKPMAICDFPNGLRISEETTLGRQEIIYSATAELVARYNYQSLATFKLYMLNKRENQRLLALNEDPFDYYGISDPQIKSDNSVRSRATDGPVILSIGSFNQQPFSEGITYTLGVTLEENNNWAGGSLRYLDYLELKAPDPYVYLDGEPQYPKKDLSGKSTCAFYYTGEKDNNGYKVYRLKDEYLDMVNVDCSKEALRNVKDLSSEECIQLYKGPQTFTCNFIIPEVPPNEAIFADYLVAETSFVYETKKTTAVDIRRRHEFATTGPLTS